MREFSIRCQKCGAGLAVDQADAGAKSFCPKCGKQFVFPHPEPPRREPVLLGALTLIVVACAVVYMYQTGYSEGTKEGRSGGYASGVLFGRKEGHESAMATGQKAGYAEGYRQGLAEGETKGEAAGKVSGFTHGFREGWTNGQALGFADGVKQGIVEGEKTGNVAGQKVGYAEGYRQGMTEGEAKGKESGKLAGYLGGVRQGMVEGEAKGTTTGMKAGYDEGLRLGWVEGQKSVWGALNLKVGTPESLVLKWLGKPDKDEGFVGEANSTLVYGNVRIHITTAYDGLRKVDFWKGDIKEYLGTRLNENMSKP